MNPLSKLAMAFFALAGTNQAGAHIVYAGHDFGSFTGVSSHSVSLTGKLVSGNYGWAHGTTEHWGDSHKLRPFRFQLQAQARVTITVTASTNGGTRLGDLLPGFSVYRGLAHLPPAAEDHDYSDISTAYVFAVTGTFKQGCFRALETWKMGNDEGETFDDLSTFVYAGHAADGTFANFGGSDGVWGDGVADGTVARTFILDPGDHSLFVGGADLESSGGNLRGFNITVSVSPATPLDIWAQNQGLEGASSDPTADPDGDGLSNLAEYALGGTPGVSDRAAHAPQVSQAAEKLRLTAVVRSGDAGLIVAAETNTEIGNSAGWTSAGVVALADVDQTGVPAGFLRVAYEVDGPGTQPRFLRLRFQR